MEAFPEKGREGSEHEVLDTKVADPRCYQQFLQRSTAGASDPRETLR